MSIAIDKCLPFFKTLKLAFQWTDKCEATFQALKDYLSRPPLLSSSVKREDFFFILGRILDSGKLDIDPRRTPDSKANLLHEPSFPRHGSKIPKDRKAGFHLDHRIKEASSLLPGTHDTGHDRPTIVKGYG